MNESAITLALMSEMVMRRWVNLTSGDDTETDVDDADKLELLVLSNPAIFF